MKTARIDEDIAPREKISDRDSAALRRACMEEADGEDLTFIEGHDDALVGVAEVDGAWRVVYDSKAIVHRLMRRDGMDVDGAWEFFEYNVAGAQAGSASPVLIRKLRRV